MGLTSLEGNGRKSVWTVEKLSCDAVMLNASPDLTVALELEWPLIAVYSREKQGQALIPLLISHWEPWKRDTQLW